jgi:NAD(P)-dependent dehydrogenase (short-subunit alcohol dehydrogenase family)
MRFSFEHIDSIRRAQRSSPRVGFLLNSPVMRPKTVFITGASSGIGRALALEYASGGAKIAVGARREPDLASLVKEIAARGGTGVAIKVDVADTDAAREAVLRADRELGGLDMVVANAGRGDTKHSSILTYDEAAAVFQVNLNGAIATVLAAVPIMLAQKSGQIVGVTSIAGRRGLPHSAAYSGSKAAFSMFLESMRIDLAPAGIRVTDVQPGFVETPMSDNVKGKAPMPFLWPVDRAARHIARRLESAPAAIAFPWQLSMISSFGRLVPAWIYDRIVRGQMRAE